jgi:peptidoglycan/LPS O-acetylase OafA/YrhL
VSTLVDHGADYRRDIDGLRALAVLAVIGFHAELQWLRGGFAGVDIFFVISGYLISSLIFRALAKGTFSVPEFYVRRINRIFPALLVVLAFCLIAGWVTLMPGEYRSLGKHTFGGSAFISNVLLWREAGYFDSPDKPLLHLWSLAIEEQFYLVWPAVCLIVWRRRWNPAWALIAIIAGSFAMNLWNVLHGQTVAAFYFPGARFWEILSGALLAHLESRRPRGGAVTSTRKVASVAGMILIAGTIASVQSSTPWPGWWALGPVLGTCLVIGAGPQAWVNRHILGSAPMVWIGLISYPMYLWHWPLMVGAKLVNGGPVGTRVMSGIIAATIVLAWITFRIVEAPIRFGAHKRRSASVLFPALVATGLLGVAVHRGIVEPRLYRASAAFDRARNDWLYPSFGGLDHYGGNIVMDSIDGTGDDVVALIGDSHMQQYWARALRLSQGSDKFPKTFFLTYGSCVPMPNVERRAGNSPITGRPFECDRFHRQAMSVIRQPRVRTVVYTAAWENYLTNGATFITTQPSAPSLRTTGPQTDSAFRMFARELQSLTASGKNVFIILSNPRLTAFDPVSMIPARLPGIQKPAPRLFVTRSDILDKKGAVTARLREVAAESGARLIDPLAVLCSGDRCPTVWRGGAPVYIDDSHMSASFVRERATFLDSVFRK